MPHRAVSGTAADSCQRGPASRQAPDGCRWVCLLQIRPDARRHHLAPAVAVGGSRAAGLVLSVADLLAGNDTHTVHVDASASGLVSPHLGLPSLMVPDVRDLTVSPGSVGLVPRLWPGRGLCAQLMPTTLAVRKFSAFHILPEDVCRPQE